MKSLSDTYRITIPVYRRPPNMLEDDSKIGLTIQQLSASSDGVVIPAEWRRDLEIERGDVIDAEYNREDRTVTYHF